MTSLVPKDKSNNPKHTRNIPKYTRNNPKHTRNNPKRARNNPKHMRNNQKQFCHFLFFVVFGLLPKNKYKKKHQGQIAYQINIPYIFFYD